MVLHILNQISQSLLKLIPLEDMAEYSSLSLSLSSDFWLDFGSDFWVNFLLQYNEILGKGASKTVYVNTNLWILIFTAYPFQILSQFEVFESSIVFSANGYVSKICQIWISELGFFLGIFLSKKFKSPKLFGHIFTDLFCFVVLIGAVTEHLMSMRGLKLLGTRSSYMISFKALKIWKGSTVKFTCSKHWSTRTLWSSTLLGLILLTETSILWPKCSLLGP